VNEGEVRKALERAYGAIDPSLDRSGHEVVEGLEAASGRAYPPAAPAGSPPARRTGVYQGAFRHRAASRTLSVWNTARHFKWLEEGTRKMQARPVLGVARTLMARHVPPNLARDIVEAERKGRGR
jgi:hypothetical protein